ncbi:MAG: tRNA (N(6)-L-threonylcarbamoyladenosine(37)-C(2))-methylthiotransferase MtaB [Planctomycetota bacterium]|nr:MAG: tRNA (N(6)-L-threonylcarbamoyladenosine(37)-C(2))-methylthiotransferase MtaB [Planctomycetota bacterium]REJ88343.1 MAG: tRNA (N(6)-L-threonylcarbamoyladenosine(37)-C(2))-methylthiotransferase MtaB [Planctomycetota bacterium]REK30695.1 MAG: tRNA (N(6)-L-threonylcarbamoyladenosine(37)-C(2))-methylthiotransferase MtaB [Planctomycetota bacterium]REK33070.1 MAG: tRNA (N(6)-L-threonylcarbamoyladenosine(37)-C(2))-methylthiotransferase MtaB [Planctomycetota bacterium]
MSQRTCRLVTLGCKVNQYETQLVKEALEQSGFREAAGDEAADLCVVNTCTVTSEGDAKSRKVIRQLSRENAGTRTIVMGCYATRDPEAVARLPGVFEVITDKREMPDVLSRQGVSDIPHGISYFQGRKRAYVKVQDGCLLRCSYCIIPQVRPGLRSRAPAEIENEVRRLVDNGYREVVISGIHVGHFGVDTTRGKSGRPPFRLWHLFRRLDRIPGDWRMRLSSIEANEINDDFISAAADCEHLCPQFHPALQSGSDAVLSRMRRRYKVGRFLEKLDRIREVMPDVAFTTDVIVGFPGETDAEFKETLDACRRAQFMKIHVFPFSARKGTPAATAQGQISPEVRKSRVRELGELERQLARRYYETLVGREMEVLVERECRDRPGYVSGTDRHYVPVVLPGDRSDVGRFVSARGAAGSREFLWALR